MKNLLIVDDHAVLRETLAEFFRSSIPDIIVLEAGNYSDALLALESNDLPDLILVDFRMPGGNGVEGVKRIIDRYPGVPVVLISGAIMEAELEAARSIGIAGYVPKSFGARSVLDIVFKVFREGSYFPPLSGTIARTLHLQEQGRPASPPPPVLTDRQRQVLRRIIDGRTNKEIAREFGISEATVKEHVSRIFDTLGVRNRADAVAYALRRSVLESGQ